MVTCLHLLFNMYGLFVVGQDVEQKVGTKKFLWVYFIGGLAAALCSLYVNVFKIGVGASGAIFAVFGFALITDIAHARREKRSIAPLLINFFLFLIINLVLAESLNADNAAHFGGLAFGLIIGGIYLLNSRAILIAPIVVINLLPPPPVSSELLQLLSKSS
ncbi:MAG: rhomboid family intramembrane serine protease [Bacteroidota bacterium]